MVGIIIEEIVNSDDDIVNETILMIVIKFETNPVSENIINIITMMMMMIRPKQIAK